jgi:hypothetical protein
MADGQHFSGHDNNIGKAQDSGPAKDAPSPFHAELQSMQGKPEAAKQTDTQAPKEAAQEAPKGDNAGGEKAVAKAADQPMSKTEQEFNDKSPSQGIEDAHKSMSDKLSQITQPDKRNEMVAQLQDAMAFHAERNAAQGLGNANLANHMPAFSKSA